MDGEGRKTILVVDDNPEERTIFATYLRFVGYEVLTAENGEECLQVAQDSQPDLILLDLNMPVLNGWETIDRLSGNRAVLHIPVMALTAQHLDRETLDAAGFCGYLEKPLAPYRVLMEVERCIGVAGIGTAPEASDAASPVERTTEWRRPNPLTEH